MLSNTCSMINSNRRLIIPIHFSIFVSLFKILTSTVIVLYLRRGKSSICVAKTRVKTLILSLLLGSLHSVFKIVLLTKVYFDMSFSGRDFCCVVLVVLEAWSVASFNLFHHALVTVKIWIDVVQVLWIGSTCMWGCSRIYLLISLIQILSLNLSILLSIWCC